MSNEKFTDLYEVIQPRNKRAIISVEVYVALKSAGTSPKRKETRKKIGFAFIGTKSTSFESHRTSAAKSISDQF